MRLRSVSEGSRIPRLFSEGELSQLENRSGITRLKGLFTPEITLVGPQRAHTGPNQAGKRWFNHLQATIFADSATFSRMGEKLSGNVQWNPAGRAPWSSAPVTDITGSQHNDLERQNS